MTKVITPEVKNLAKILITVELISFIIALLMTIFLIIGAAYIYYGKKEVVIETKEDATDTKLDKNKIAKGLVISGAVMSSILMFILAYGTFLGFKIKPNITV